MTSLVCYYLFLFNIIYLFKYFRKDIFQIYTFNTQNTPLKLNLTLKIHRNTPLYHTHNVTLVFGTMDTFILTTLHANGFVAHSANDTNSDRQIYALFIIILFKHMGIYHMDYSQNNHHISISTNLFLNLLAHNKKIRNTSLSCI